MKEYWDRFVAWYQGDEETAILDWRTRYERREAIFAKVVDIAFGISLVLLIFLIGVGVGSW